MAAGNPDPVVGDECWKIDLEAISSRSLQPVVARIHLEAMVTTWKVDRL
jgi:hypothetical protein